jgi:hypothetical protein
MHISSVRNGRNEHWRFGINRDAAVVLATVLLEDHLPTKTILADARARARLIALAAQSEA